MIHHAGVLRSGNVQLKRLFVVFCCFALITTHTAKSIVPMSTVEPGVSTEKCPDGFVRFQDSCYSFYVEQFSWPEALVFCQALKYSLVTLTSPAQYEFLRTHLATISGSYPEAAFWTAGTAAELLGDWTWINNGKTIDFQQFNATDPNKEVSTDQNSGCLALSTVSRSKSYKVKSQACETTLHFICERHGNS